jgi:hypothetical protein
MPARRDLERVWSPDRPTRKARRNDRIQVAGSLALIALMLLAAVIGLL